ncbi:GAF domain-containing protein [Caerostris darwini]|uniref:GAF domain-containing protein n=1 Tax=Caerostris darwini TaxID=1538125 RepID=A0AAV4QC22_9ARAC|nr:GAF domain-containing protein [Caerostris darwini]
MIMIDLIIKPHAGSSNIRFHHTNPVFSPDYDIDSRFNKDIDTRTGYRTISVMCQPILNFQGDVIGVAQCINKVTGDHQFTDQDQEVR